MTTSWKRAVGAFLCVAPILAAAPALAEGKDMNSRKSIQSSASSSASSRTSGGTDGAQCESTATVRRVIVENGERRVIEETDRRSGTDACDARAAIPRQAEKPDTRKQ